MAKGVGLELTLVSLWNFPSVSATHMPLNRINANVLMGVTANYLLSEDRGRNSMRNERMLLSYKPKSTSVFSYLAATYYTLKIL